MLFFGEVTVDGVMVVMGDMEEEEYLSVTAEEEVQSLCIDLFIS
jgi:hypothetical protein